MSNAGSADMALCEDMREGDFDHRLTRVLLKGPCFLTQTLLPLMADDGVVVHTSSNPATAARRRAPLNPGVMAPAPDAGTRVAGGTTSAAGPNSLVRARGAAHRNPDGSCDAGRPHTR
ncbi:hypothetical protein [Streptomyces sp. NPDC059072]|uniref:hypothetical protein n=1 Tax=Streptomyces sp. NPDC059072 TaxID=3346715 RepID=UPI00369F3971